MNTATNMTKSTFLRGALSLPIVVSAKRHAAYVSNVNGDQESPSATRRTELNGTRAPCQEPADENDAKSAFSESSSVVSTPSLADVNVKASCDAS